MYLMMRSKTCRVPWIKKHTAPAVNRDASSELPKTVHIFPEVKLHTFPEFYIFLYFFKIYFQKCYTYTYTNTQFLFLFSFNV